MNGHGEMAVVATGPGSAFWVLSLLIIAGVGYLTGVHRLRSRGDDWPHIRSTAAGVGLLCLAVAVQPAPSGVPAFAAHVVQHLLVAMLGPLLIALSAPITLALRVLPRTGRRRLMAILHSRIVSVLSVGPVVLALNIGALYGYYLTPLYDVAHQQPWLQGLLHLHMFLAGCLLSWYLIGRDPMTRRPSTPSAVAVLLLAAAAHDVLAKLLYARQLPQSGGTQEELELGAQIMYYGGTAIELLTAALLMATWYARTGRALQNDRRRSGAADGRSRPGRNHPGRV